MLFAPRAAPRPIVDKLHAEMDKIMKDADTKAQATAIGLLPIDTPAIADTEKCIAREPEKWGDLVRKLGLEGSQ